MKVLLALLAANVAPVAVPIVANVKMQENKSTNQIINITNQFQGYFNWNRENIPEEFNFEVTPNFNLSIVDKFTDDWMVKEDAVGNGILWQGWLSQYVEDGYIQRTVFDYLTGQESKNIVPHPADEATFYQVIYTVLPNNPYNLEVGSQIKINIGSGHGSLIDVSNIQDLIDEEIAQPLEFKNVVDSYSLSKEEIVKRVDEELIKANVEGDIDKEARYETNFLFNLIKKDNIDTYFEYNSRVSQIPFIPNKGETINYKMVIKVLPNPNDNYVDDQQITIDLTVTNPNGYDISSMQEAFTDFIKNNPIKLPLHSLNDFSESEFMYTLDVTAKKAGIETLYGDIPLNFFTNFVGKPGFTYSFNDNTELKMSSVEGSTTPNTVTFKTTDSSTIKDLIPGKELTIEFNIFNSNKTENYSDNDIWKSGYRYQAGADHVYFNEDEMIDALKSTILDIKAKPGYVQGSLKFTDFYLTRNTTTNKVVKEFEPVKNALNQLVKNPTTKLKLTGEEYYILFKGYQYKWVLNDKIIFDSGKKWDKNPNLEFHVFWTYDIKVA